MKAAQLLTKKGLQADKTRKGMSAERGAAADTAAAEEKEERSIAAADAQAAATLRVAVAQERVAKAVETLLAAYKLVVSRMRPAGSSPLTRCRMRKCLRRRISLSV